ncbi:uncharacterized protein LOC113147578 [Cyclospora cayetanensis]|uniref:Uncharacterized protein LOC113147578 n=1 Tax=Cyclospora cayetanensis TaxID=88456 RepID=A0A6P6S2K5_9EIME|nr:uncharacterized protein LOC113147578 [Cyclospora cayetanensis]
MITPAAEAWRGDVEFTYADPDEVLDPGAFSVAEPLYSVDSELSTESSNKQWSCRLLPCLPPLGLVSASIGLQLGAALLLLAAATNGQRLHGLTPSLLDPELPLIRASFKTRDPRTYAWCLAYAWAWSLIIFVVLAVASAIMAVLLGCCKWARVLRALSIVQSLISLGTALTCCMWLSGYSVSQSSIDNAAVDQFLEPFNYGTLLFAKTHEVILRATGGMTAAAAAAAARASRATCHDTATGAMTTSAALIASWAASFLQIQAALGGMAPPVFGVPAVLLSCACLICLNFGCLERWNNMILTMLFLASAFVATVAWVAAQEVYAINYSTRPHSDSFIVKLLKKLVDIEQWGIALGMEVGVACFAVISATQSVLCIFATTVMFYRVFGHRIEACRRKRKQRKRDKATCETRRHSPCSHPAAVISTYTSPVAKSPVSILAPSAKILVPPPPHAVLP